MVEVRASGVSVAGEAIENQDAGAALGQRRRRGGERRAEGELVVGDEDDVLVVGRSRDARETRERSVVGGRAGRKQGAGGEHEGVRAGTSDGHRPRGRVDSEGVDGLGAGARRRDGASGGKAQVAGRGSGQKVIAGRVEDIFGIDPRRGGKRTQTAGVMPYERVTHVGSGRRRRRGLSNHVGEDASGGGAVCAAAAHGRVHPGGDGGDDDTTAVFGDDHGAVGDAAEIAADDEGGGVIGAADRIGRGAQGERAETGRGAAGVVGGDDVMAGPQDDRADGLGIAGRVVGIAEKQAEAGRRVVQSDDGRVDDAVRRVVVVVVDVQLAARVGDRDHRGADSAGIASA